MATKQNTYICTRPQLVGILIQQGCNPTPTVNPWNPDKAAWLFDLDDNSAQIISDYYNSIDKPTPTSVQRYIKGA